MNKILSFSGLTLLVASLAFSAMAQTEPIHRQCGRGVLLERMAKEDPELYRQTRARQLAATKDALALMEKTSSASKINAKATATGTIPVVFHFVLTPAQYTQLNRDSGIVNRVRTNLASLNKDYNRQNADSSLIPAAFKPYYASIGLQFGIASLRTSRTISPGIEVLILSGTPPVYSVDDACANVKVAGSTGLAPADPTKYINIWVCNVTNSTPSSGTILGITTRQSDIGYTYTTGGPAITINEIGIVLNYQAIGVRTYSSQNFFTNIDLGRTLTHEMGHYFELDHVWGDDGGLCPTNGGADDGISDTPPQTDATYCTATCPTFPKTDACSPTSPGIMFMNYMDYTDDRAMQMFTIKQAQRMQATVQSGQENYGVTQHPDLVNSKGVVGVENTVASLEHSISAWPNPANDVLNISISGSAQPQAIYLVDMLGRSVAHVALNSAKDYKLPLTDLPHGIYTLSCLFENGLVTQKIVVE